MEIAKWLVLSLMGGESAQKMLENPQNTITPNFFLPLQSLYLDFCQVLTKKIAELKYNEEVDWTPLESLLGLTSMCQVNEKYQWMEVHTAQRRED